MFFIGTADVPYIPISEDRGFTALLIIARFSSTKVFATFLQLCDNSRSTLKIKGKKRVN